MGCHAAMAFHDMQVDFVVAFLAVTYARAVAAPLNAAYKEVGGLFHSL